MWNAPKTVLLVPLLAASALLMTGCSLFGGSEPTEIRVTVTATPSIDPSASPNGPTPSQEVEPTTAQAPFQAVVSIAEVSIDAATLRVAGFASGIVEDDGRCIFTITSATTGAAVTAETLGVANVATSSCGSTDVPISQLDRGTWTVTLTYESSNGSVTSLPLAVEVP